MSIAAVLLAYISLFAFGLGDNIRGPLFSEILSEFGLSDTTGSLIFALTSLIAFFSSFSAPRLGHWMGHKKLLQMSLVFLAGGLGTFSLAQSLGQTLIAATLFGMSLGGLGYCQNALVVMGTSPLRRQQWLSGLHAMYALSSLLAPSLVALLASHKVHWRVSFAAAMAFPLLTLVISWTLPLSENLSQSLGRKPQGPRRRSLTEFFRVGPNQGLQWLAGISFAFYVVAEIIVATRLGLFFRRGLSESLESSSLKVAGFFALMLIGRGFFTFFRPSISLFVCLSLSLCLSILVLSIGLLGSPLFLVLSGLTLGPFYGLGMAYLTSIFKDDAGQAISTSVSLQSLFLVAVQLGVGGLSDHWSLRTALWVAPLSLLLSLYFLWRTHERQKI